MSGSYRPKSNFTPKELATADEESREALLRKSTTPYADAVVANLYADGLKNPKTSPLMDYQIAMARIEEQRSQSQWQGKAQPPDLRGLPVDPPSLRQYSDELLDEMANQRLITSAQLIAAKLERDKWMLVPSEMETLDALNARLRREHDEADER